MDQKTPLITTHRVHTPSVASFLSSFLSTIASRRRMAGRLVGGGLLFILAGTIQFSCGQTWRLIGTSGVQNELQGCWYHTPNGEQLSDCRRFSLYLGERGGVRASVFSTAPFRLGVCDPGNK